MVEPTTLAALVAATSEQAQLATKLIGEQQLKIKVFEYHENISADLRHAGTVDHCLRLPGRPFPYLA